MITTFEPWLTELARAQKGGWDAALRADRGLPFAKTVQIVGAFPGSTLRGQIRAAPDAAGDPLATFTVSAPVIADGTTTFILTLASSGANSTGELPSAPVGEEVIAFPYDLLFTPADGTEGRLFGGPFIVIGKITTPV